MSVLLALSSSGLHCLQLALSTVRTVHSSYCASFHRYSTGSPLAHRLCCRILLKLSRAATAQKRTSWVASRDRRALARHCRIRGDPTGKLNPTRRVATAEDSFLGRRKSTSGNAAMRTGAPIHYVATPNPPRRTTPARHPPALRPIQSSSDLSPHRPQPAPPSARTGPSPHRPQPAPAPARATPHSAAGCSRAPVRGATAPRNTAGAAELLRWP
jgi:hypothetical protein